MPRGFQLLRQMRGEMTFMTSFPLASGVVIKINISQMKSFRRASDEANEDIPKRRRQEALKNVKKQKIIYEAGMRFDEVISGPKFLKRRKKVGGPVLLKCTLLYAPLANLAICKNPEPASKSSLYALGSPEQRNATLQPPL